MKKTPNTWMEGWKVLGRTGLAWEGQAVEAGRMTA